MLHLVQFGEMAVPVLAALFLEINSGVILIMMAFLILHQVTAIWDVQYASATREVSPTEQHVHSVLEMLPFTGLLLVIAAPPAAATVDTPFRAQRRLRGAAARSKGEDD